MQRRLPVGRSVKHIRQSYAPSNPAWSSSGFASFFTATPAPSPRVGVRKHQVHRALGRAPGENPRWGQATRRELALGLRSAEASLAATRGRSRWRRGGTGARETQLRRLPSRSALGALDLLLRLGPRAETASMLRRSLPFQPTLLAISSSNARALPTSPPARLAGRQPSPADLVGQAVRLRGLPQASPQVCKGVAYCSKDCQVCVASHPACALSRPFAQRDRQA